MGKGAVKLPLDGSELVSLYNSSNTKDVAFGSLEDVADYINSFDVPAEVLMISLLQNISRDLNYLPELVEQQKITNMHLSIMTGEDIHESDK